VRYACEHHLNDLEQSKDPSFPYYFDEDAAQHAINFCRYCHHSAGEWAGQVFQPALWQQFILAAAFGWMRRSDSTRRYRILYAELARKAGKSTLASIVGLYMLLGDGEPGSEVYSAASRRDQARVVHGCAARMVAASPELRQKIGTFKDHLYLYSGAGRYDPLGADADACDGLNVHAAVCDELHVWRSGDLWHKLITGTASRRQPLIVGITTAGDDKESFCYYMHDHAVKVLRGDLTDDPFFAYIATLDDADDPFNQAVWIKANPSLGICTKLDTLQQHADRARQVPTELNSFLRLHLNKWVESLTAWIPTAVFEECATLTPELRDALTGRRCWAALDLASTRDLTALALAFPLDDGTVALLIFHWIPEETLREHELTDRVPYSYWQRMAWVETTPGNVTDYGVVRERIKQLATLYDIQEVAYDPHNALDLIQDLQRDGFNCVAHSQAIMQMSPPTKETEKLILSRRLRHAGNECLRWQMSCVAIYTDANQNIKIKKDRSSGRVDGVVAMVMAVGRAVLMNDDGSGSIYNNPDLESPWINLD